MSDRRIIALGARFARNSSNMIVIDVATDSAREDYGGRGLVTTSLQLTNPREPSLAPIEVAALADTGSVFLCIPEDVSCS